MLPVEVVRQVGWCQVGASPSYRYVVPAGRIARSTCWSDSVVDGYSTGQRLAGRWSALSSQQSFVRRVLQFRAPVFVQRRADLGDLRRDEAWRHIRQPQLKRGGRGELSCCGCSGEREKDRPVALSLSLHVAASCSSARCSGLQSTRSLSRSTT